MPNPIETLPRTGIAAISWGNANDVQVRVYTQDINGGIRESRFDGKINAWSGGNAQDVIANAKPNSPIAAFAYGGKPQIRVFYLSTDNIIHGVRQDEPGSKWVTDTINKGNIEASPASRLAFAGPFGRSEYRIFYQLPRGGIGHAEPTEDSWVYTGSFGEKPLIGTGLAAVSFQATDSKGPFNALRVYYQRSDGTVTDHGLEGAHDLTSLGQLAETNVAPSANLAAISEGDDKKPVFLLFYPNKDLWVSEGSFYDGGWHFENHPGETKATPSTGIAVVRNYGLLRVYYQDATNEVVEFAATAPSASGKKTVVPTGKVQ